MIGVIVRKTLLRSVDLKRQNIIYLFFIHVAPTLNANEKKWYITTKTVKDFKL